MLYIIITQNTRSEHPDRIWYSYNLSILYTYFKLQGSRGHPGYRGFPGIPGFIVSIDHKSALNVNWIAKELLIFHNVMTIKMNQTAFISSMLYPKHTSLPKELPNCQTENALTWKQVLDQISQPNTVIWRDHYFSKLFKNQNHTMLKEPDSHSAPGESETYLSLT